MIACREIDVQPRHVIVDKARQETRGENVVGFAIQRALLRWRAAGNWSGSALGQGGGGSQNAGRAFIKLRGRRNEDNKPEAAAAMRAALRLSVLPLATDLLTKAMNELHAARNTAIKTGSRPNSKTTAAIHQGDQV